MSNMFTLSEDPILAELEQALMLELIKILKEQDAGSSMRWGVFRVLPMGSGAFPDTPELSEGIAGGVGLLCSDELAGLGWGIGIFSPLNDSTTVKIQLVPAMLNRIKLNRVTGGSCTVHRVAISDITSKVDSLITAFKENPREIV